MNRLPRAVRWAARIHDGALRLLPPDFRAAFGAEIGSVFREQAWAAWMRGGTTSLAWMTLRAVADTMRHATAGRTALVGPDEPGRGRVSWRGQTPGRGGGTMPDLTNGVRQLTRNPVLSTIAVLTLALGIGATTSMFSVVNGVLIEALPFPEPDRLVRLFHVDPARGSDRGALSLPDLEDWEREASSFSAMAAYSDLPSGPLFTTGDEPLELRTAYVSGGFFETMGTPPALGRGLRGDEEERDNRVVVVSHAFWETALGADSSAVGGTLMLDDQPYRLAGVMPPAFAFPHERIQAWLFLSVIPPSSIPLAYRPVRILSAVGRLADGVTIDRATEELSAINRSLLERYPEENEGLEAAALVPLHETITAGVSRPLVLLLLGVSAVLLIVCVNVATLLLSRGLERTREMAVRSALGATRRRLLRQFLTEAVVLAAVGGGAGLALTLAIHGVLTSHLTALLPRAGAIDIDAAVLAFAAGVSTLSAVAFGTAPALVVTGGSPAAPLREGGRGATGGSGARNVWNALVATEVALALVLIVAAGLLLRSLWALGSVEPGLEVERLASLSLTFNDGRYEERPEYLAAYDALMERLAAIPGVTGVGSIRFAPTRLPGESTGFRIPSRPDPAASNERARLLQVSPGFFSVVGTPVLAGREFTTEDRAEGPPVAVVNEAFRRRYLAGEEPLDLDLELGGDPARIVGVVGDILQEGPGEPPAPTVYLPQAQNPRRGMSFLIATDGDPAVLQPAIRSAVREVDPDQPIELLTPMRSLMAQATARDRFFAAVLGGFGTLALLLASLGVYGVVSTTVGRRTREIGTRLALGADRSTILRSVVAAAMRPVLAGVAIGAATAWLGAKALESLVFGVDPRDPLTFTAVVLVLVGVAALASWVPAGRASRLDPVRALRAE